MTYTSLEVDTFPELLNELIKQHSKIVTADDNHAHVPWYFCKECLHLYPCKTITLISKYITVDVSRTGCSCGKDCDVVEDQETQQF
jgi:hypothetical protein